MQWYKNESRRWELTHQATINQPTTRSSPTNSVGPAQHIKFVIDEMTYWVVLLQQNIKNKRVLGWPVSVDVDLIDPIPSGTGGQPNRQGGFKEGKLSEASHMKLGGSRGLPVYLHFPRGTEAGYDWLLVLFSQTLVLCVAIFPYPLPKQNPFSQKQKVDPPPLVLLYICMHYHFQFSLLLLFSLKSA